MRPLQATCSVSSSSFIHKTHITASTNPDQNLLWQKYLLSYLLLHLVTQEKKRKEREKTERRLDGLLQLRDVGLLKAWLFKEVSAQRKEERGEEACINYPGEFVEY